MRLLTRPRLRRLQDPGAALLSIAGLSLGVGLVLSTALGVPWRDAVAWVAWPVLLFAGNADADERD